VSSERETIETDTERHAGNAGNSKEMSGERECMEKGGGKVWVESSRSKGLEIGDQGEGGGERSKRRGRGWRGGVGERGGEREARGGEEVVFVGIDCEWNMHREREYSKINRRLTPSIIQISFLGRVFVVDCNAALYFL
jgi:hypothetical protein